MDDDSTSTTTIFSTTTMVSTRTLTRTVVSIPPTPSTSIIFVPADNPHFQGHHHDLTSTSLYPYDPSLALAIIFTILYVLVAGYHGYLTLYLPTRPDTISKHRYTIPLFLASVLSAIGFFLRCFSIQEQQSTNVGLYTISNALIIISPIFLCATLYLLLSRLIIRCLPAPTSTTPTTHTASCPNPTSTATHRANLQKFLLLPPAILSALFLVADAVSFLLQSLGASIAASNSYQEPHLSKGTHTVLGGLVLQLITFLLYLVSLHLFCLRVRNSAIHGFNPCIMRVITATWIASGFVLIRTLFRLGEFAQGPYGYGFNHEWCLYVFEAFPVWVAFMILGWAHPIKWIQERVLAAARTTPRKPSQHNRQVTVDHTADNGGRREDSYSPGATGRDIPGIFLNLLSKKGKNEAQAKQGNAVAEGDVGYMAGNADGQDEGHHVRRRSRGGHIHEIGTAS